MKIKDLHPDVERYLQKGLGHRGICSFDGFYQLFYEDQECIKIGEGRYGDQKVIFCVAHPSNDETLIPQIVLFFIKDHKVDTVLRYDTNENNIKLTKMWMKDGYDKILHSDMYFTKYTKEEAVNAPRNLLNIANAVMTD